MWWDSLPSFALVIATLAAPQVIVLGYNLLFLGNPYSRRLHTNEDAFYFLRDKRISNRDDPYRQIGLSEVDLGED